MQSDIYIYIYMKSLRTNIKGNDGNATARNKTEGQLDNERRSTETKNAIYKERYAH